MSEVINIQAYASDVDGFGSINLPFDAAYLFSLGYEYGDVFKLTINDTVYHLPFTDVFGQVPFGGDTICTNEGEGNLCINKNMVGFAEYYKWANKHTEGMKVAWTLNNVDVLNIQIEMYEKGGYLKELSKYISDVKYEVSIDRNKYKNLNDEEYANFRPLNIPNKIIFRGSSPFETKTGRTKIVESLLKKYNIKNVITLANKETSEENYPGISSTYYASLNTKTFLYELNPNSDNTLKALNNIVNFINDNEGNFYIHCIYGRDRTGILCTIIEALAHSNLNEIIDEYKKSFCNLFNIEKNNKFNDSIVQSVFYPVLQYISDSQDIENIDLYDAAYKYLLRAKLSREQIDKFISKIK